MFKFIHAADIHLDSPLYGLEQYEGAPIDEIRGATRQAFINLVSLAIDENVDFIILAGDIYDGDWKDFNTGLFFNAQMSELRKHSIKAYIVHGNHDSSSGITKKLKLPDNVKVFSSRKAESFILEDIAVAIHGYSFSQRAVTDNLSEKYPASIPDAFNIGVLHTCLDGKPGHEPYAPCTVAGLKSKKYQYWALGHVHRREIISEEPWIVFPGNIQGRHIRETGPKGCSLISVVDDDVTVDEYHLDVMRWVLKEIDLSDTKTIEDVYELTRQTFSELLNHSDDRTIAVRLHINGNTPCHSELHTKSEQFIQELRAMANDLGGSGIWLEKIKIKTSEEKSIEEVLERDDALGGLVRSINNFVLNDQFYNEMPDEIQSLKQKLPSILMEGIDPFDPTSEAIIQDTMKDVKEMLLAKLLTEKQP